MKKYFGTDGIRGCVGQAPMTSEQILKLGWAAGIVFASINGNKTKIAIGKDTRISGTVLELVLQAGLVSAGVDVLLLGTISTPAIAFLTRDLGVNAGIVISASHNPFQDNGIKFFDSEGYKLSDELELKIEAQWEKTFSMVEPKKLGKIQRQQDVVDRYLHFCLKTFPKNLSLKGIKLVIDCANGSTYHSAPAVFKFLEAEVIEMSVKPDGFNINDHCGSTYPETLIKKVLQTKADFGIAFDGDGDRVIMVDTKGEIYDGDDLLFIIAKWYAVHKRLTGGIVGTVMSNSGLENALKALGLAFTRTAVGDHHVLECAKEKGWNLGGESSGHILCLEYSTTGDGVLTALQVLAASLSSGLSLAQLTEEMIKYPQILLNVPLPSLESSGIIMTPTMQEKLLDTPILKTAIQDAERLLQGEGRVLIRASGTEPIIKVMVEGRDKKLVQAIAQQLVSIIEKIM